MNELLQVKELSVGYPVRTGFLEGLRSRKAGMGSDCVQALDGVDLVLKTGEVLALVGESGCGKTTTGKAILRLIEDRYVKGKVGFDGMDVYGLRHAELPEFRRKAQMIYQDPYQSLNPKDSVFEIVGEPLKIFRLASGKELRNRAAAALDEAGLKPASAFMDRFPHELSGGQRQRVAIASALILEPKFIVADEPVSMLDLSVRAGIIRLLAGLREKMGLAFLFITHDLSLAWLIADRVAIMYLGRIVEEGPVDEVISHSIHPYSRALVKVMPRFEPRAGKPRELLTGEPPDPSRIPTGCRFRPRCRFAIERCALEDPLLMEVPTMVPGHRAACHRAGQLPT